MNFLFVVTRFSGVRRVAAREQTENKDCFAIPTRKAGLYRHERRSKQVLPCVTRCDSCPVATSFACRLRAVRSPHFTLWHGWHPAGPRSDSGAEFITTATQAAIDRGLAQLAQGQANDGSFADPTRTGTSGGITGLGGLALMSAGHQPGRGRYGKNVTRAVDHVLQSGKRGQPRFSHLRGSPVRPYGQPAQRDVQPRVRQPLPCGSVRDDAGGDAAEEGSRSAGTGDRVLRWPHRTSEGGYKGGTNRAPRLPMSP